MVNLSKEARKKQSSEGLWHALNNAETRSMSHIADQLDPFGSAVCNCYEAGVQAQCLPCRRHGEIDLRIAGLFLKRVLTDLRGMWLLTIRGYTGQAASLAASLFEHALAAETIAGNPERAEQCMNKAELGIPWSVKELARLARGRAADSQAEVTYFTYRWLCKIKHPTIPSLLNEARSTKLDSNAFVIMALPNATEEDISLKGLILTDGLLEAKTAISAFVEASEPSTTTLAYADFQDRMTRFDADLRLAFWRTCKAGSPLRVDPRHFAIQAFDNPFEDSKPEPLP